MASVKVAVRVRPFNQREIEMGATSIIQMQGKTTLINAKANGRDEAIKQKQFTYDYSYWSIEPNATNFANQELVYNDLGIEVVECAFQGYNACVFAYGQTGSGKTFTMMGSHENPGLIPRICKTLFNRMLDQESIGTTHRVQVSYLEIYQERVVDLLRDRNATVLRVREHPKRGPYVQGLTSCIVTNFKHIEECMQKGNSHRTTAATNMNDVSSRSHAIFTIQFVQAGYCDGVPSETVSKIHLVDLAGSERADSSGATGQRLKEGAHINKSLVTLGSVISALAEQSKLLSKLTAATASNEQKHASSGVAFIPYRDSVLTWLLKDSLGGNSKTFMIATVSPADCNYGETLSTLRYAHRAKNIINQPMVNEDQNVKLIRELRAEIAKLKAAMLFGGNITNCDNMLAQLHRKEALETRLTEEWTGKWREAQAILREQRALGLRKSGHGVVLDSDRPHLVAIDDDPLSTGVTLYHLREGATTIGTALAAVKQDIELPAVAGMLAEHCVITLLPSEATPADGSTTSSAVVVATLRPMRNAHVMLNNTQIESEVRLYQGCIMFLGRAHVFRYNDPAEAAELRRGANGDRHNNSATATCNLSRLSVLSWSTPDLMTCDAQDRSQSVMNKTDSSGNHCAIEESINISSDLQSLINQRETIEIDRQKVYHEIIYEYDNCVDVKTDILIRMNNAYQFVVLHASHFVFPEFILKRIEATATSRSTQGLRTSADYHFLMEILNCIRGPSIIQQLINEQRNELVALQSELSRRIDVLTERQLSIEQLDRRLINLIDEQIRLNCQSGRNNQSDEYNLEALKQSLANRSKEELERITRRKVSLTLQLSNVSTPSSATDTYCTALTHLNTDDVGYHHRNLMSDSGVELRPNSQMRCCDDSDMSSEDCSKSCLSDDAAPSISSVDTPLAAHHRNARNRHVKRHTTTICNINLDPNQHLLRQMAQRIVQQKTAIMRALDALPPTNATASSTHLDGEIALLQQLQRQYSILKHGGGGASSPSPLPPNDFSATSTPARQTLNALGSTASLNFPLTTSGQRLTLPMMDNCVFYRSMPSVIDAAESVVTLTHHHLTGTGFRAHYVYSLSVCTVDARWSLEHRYRRFRDLHLAMKARYGATVASIPFPARKFLFFSNTEHVAQSRQQQLQFYLRCLIERCRRIAGCPLSATVTISPSEAPPLTRAALYDFSPFFHRTD